MTDDELRELAVRAQLGPWPYTSDALYTSIVCNPAMILSLLDRIAEKDKAITTLSLTVAERLKALVGGAESRGMERAAATLEMTNQEILLMAGEMKIGELRAVQAVLKSRAAAIRRAKDEK